MVGDEAAGEVLAERAGRGMDGRRGAVTRGGGDVQAHRKPFRADAGFGFGDGVHDGDGFFEDGDRVGFGHGRYYTY